MAAVLAKKTIYFKIKRFKGNKIGEVIAQKAEKHQDAELEKQYRRELQRVMGVTRNKLSYILTNKTQMSLEEAFHAAQVLEIKMEDLVQIDDISATN